MGTFDQTRVTLYNESTQLHSGTQLSSNTYGNIAMHANTNVDNLGFDFMATQDYSYTHPQAPTADAYTDNYAFNAAYNTDCDTSLGRSDKDAKVYLAVPKSTVSNNNDHTASHSVFHHQSIDMHAADWTGNATSSRGSNELMLSPRAYRIEGDTEMWNLVARDSKF